MGLFDVRRVARQLPCGLRQHAPSSRATRHPTLLANWYEALCNWSPLLQLDFLQALTWRRSSCGRPVVRIAADVPEDWPQLAFLVSSVDRWNCIPQLPSTSPPGEAEWQLRTRLAARVGYIHQRPVQAAKVLQPLFFADAVLAGLRLWIRANCGGGNRHLNTMWLYGSPKGTKYRGPADGET